MIPVASTCVHTAADHSVHHISSQLILPTALGNWLMEQQLYAQGNDFTSEAADDPQYVGHSTFKRLWSNTTQAKEGVCDHIDLFVIVADQQAIGVVTWLNPSDGDIDLNEVRSNINHKPRKAMRTTHLGQVMAYIKPSYRGKGWVKGVFERLAPLWEELAHAAHDRGRTPVICGVDACATLLKATTVPVVDSVTCNMGLRNQMFWLWTQKLLRDTETPNSRWVQAPYLLPVSKAKRTTPIAKG